MFFAVICRPRPGARNRYRTTRLAAARSAARISSPLRSPRSFFRVSAPPLSLRSQIPIAV